MAEHPLQRQDSTELFREDLARKLGGLDQSIHNLDKTHLSNPEIAAAGAEDTQHEYKGLALLNRVLSKHGEIISRYNSGKEEKQHRESQAKELTDKEVLCPASANLEGTDLEKVNTQEREDSIFNVMSHNFGQPIAQFKETQSAAPKGKSLEAAYMVNRADELERKSNGSSSLCSQETKSDKEVKSEYETDETDWLHLCGEREHDANVNTLSDLDFSVWEYSRFELTRFAWSMYHDLGLIECFQIPAQTFKQFIHEIMATSHKVPYHNYYHYFSVLHTSWLLLNMNDYAVENLKMTDKLGCLTAAMGHDADHPGLTNSFLCATKHDFSIRYNDLSVLENHHCATTYSILMKPECNILCNLSTKEWKATRNVIVSAILNTDMARHFNLVSNFLAMFEGKGNSECFTSDKMRNQIISMIVHCADISNPIKPWFICKRFADAIAKEFRAQVELEKEANVPCTPHMLGLDTRGQAKMELGFIDVFTLPAMEALNQVLPEMDQCFENMDQNKIYWQDILESSKNQKKIEGVGRRSRRFFGKV